VDKMQLYNRLPVFLQNAACGIQGWKINRNRYSATFWRLLSEYEERSSWTNDQLNDYRDKQLRKMIHHCYNTVPYYKRLFDARDINPDSIKHLEDLSCIPILTKKIVNRNPADFISQGYTGKRIKHHTSGTTGSGFIFYTTPEAINEQWACWWRYRRALGIQYGIKQATFGTQRIVPAKQKKPPFWRYNKPCGQIYFSAFHMKDEYLYSYYKELLHSKVSWIHGYPSLLTALASYMVRKNVSLSAVKWVTTGAENLLDYQSSLIEQAFGVKPYNHYGMCEGVANFSQRIDGRMFVDEDFSAVEFISRDDGSSEVVGTTLTNYLMPLLRWQVGDVVKVNKDKYGKREIVSIDGRSEDYLYLPNGTKIGKLDHVFKDTLYFAEAQIHQNADYSITLYVVKTQDDTREDECLALRELAASLNETVPISFMYVDRVPRSDSGKLRFVVSEVERVSV